MKQCNTFFLLAALLLWTGSAAAQHFEMSTYNGAESCASCHANTKAKAMEVMQSAHYKFKGWGQGVYDHDGNHLVGEENGKWTRYCGLPGSVSNINWIGNFFNGTVAGGCGRCHIGNGEYTPDQGAADPDEAWKKIDCLLCHATTYKVNGVTINAAGKRLAVKNAQDKLVFPFPSGDDLKVTSASIKRVPAAQACSRCHSYNGGGYTFKRGLDYLVDDVHYTKGLTCTTCHETEAHKIALSRPDPALVGRDQLDEISMMKNRCENCHTDTPHAASTDAQMLNAHTAKLDCGTCHVPFHKGMSNKRFDIPVQEMTNGTFKQWNFQLDVLQPTRPAYQWWDGTVDHEHVRPRGARNAESKIHPFKITRAYIPVDKATGVPIPLKLGIVFGSPETSSPQEMQAKLESSIRTGAKQTAQRFGFPLDGEGNYTAEYEWKWDEMWGNPGHGVVRKGLVCADCHTPTGIMPFEELGYDETEIAMLRSIAVSTGSLPGAQGFTLGQAWPNPACGETSLRFTLPARGAVTVTLYDTNGREIRTLLSDKQREAGAHDLRIGTADLKNGLYFCTVSFNGRTLTNKMVVMN